MKAILRKLKINKETSIVIYAVFVLLALVGGVSYAAIRSMNRASDNTIRSGQISMTYTEPSNTVILKDALPQTDDIGIMQTEYFEFSVISNAKTNENDDKGVEIPYEISISKVAVDEAFKQLEDNQVKLYLTEINGESETPVTEPILISDLETSDYDKNAYKIHSDVNKHSNNNGSITTKYRIRFWVDYQTDASTWDENNKHEYKFKVNINASAGAASPEKTNVLAYKIKNMYTSENGLAKESDGYYYLSGAESAGETGDSPSDALISSMSYMIGIDFYRTGSKTVPADQISNIVKNNHTLGYKSKSKAVYLNNVTISTYNQEQLEKDMRYYQINVNEIPEEEFNAIIEPFGGYINVLLGAVSGVIDMEELGFVGDYTKDDIPTLDQVMANEEQKSMLLEVLGEDLASVIEATPDGFDAIYYNGSTYNKELLTENLNLGVIALDMEFMIEYVNGVFGDMTNYLIAEVTGNVEYSDEGMPTLVEGMTVEQLPTLEDIFLGSSSDSPKYLTNTYVKLNGILWEVLGVNKDNTIKLIATDYISLASAQQMHLEGEIAKYFGYGDNNNDAPFLTLIKGTTLEDIIVKANYEYEENGEKKSIKAYASLPTYNDIKNTITDGKTYLDSYYPSIAKIVQESEDVNYYNFTLDSNEILEGRASNISLFPVITIKNVEVIGTGTKTDPYMVENEKLPSSNQVAKSIAQTLLKTNAGKYSVMYYEGYGYDANNSVVSNYEGIKYTAGIKISTKCMFFNTNDEEKEIETSESCSSKIPNISMNASETINTYSFQTVPITISANNATSYQWQQKIGNEWVDLEDFTGRISGSKTNSLSITITDYFNASNQFRCIVSNEITKISSSVSTVNVVLTDGEWVYEEIGDTNKYQITSYIGDYANSAYFTQLDGSDNYKLEVPSTINGDTITTVESLINNTVAGNSTWRTASTKITTLEFAKGIEAINASFNTSIGSSSKINKIIFNEGLKSIGKINDNNQGPFVGIRTITEFNLPSSLEIIGDMAFANLSLTSLEIPENVKAIGNNAFDELPLTSLKLNNRLKTIGNYAFNGAKLTRLELPDSVERLGNYAFYKSELTTLKLSKNLKSIGARAFNASAVTNLELPNSVEEIGDYAFYQSPLTSLTLHEGIKTIGNRAFQLAKLTSLEIPRSVEVIGDYAFYQSPLTSLTLHEGLTTINSYAFSSAQLTSLSIPSSVMKIGGNAFKSSNFTEFKIYGKTSTTDFTNGFGTITMADGYEIEFVPGTLD